MATKTKDPALPRSRSNPVGGTRLINRAEKRVNKSLRQTRKWLIDQLESIPTERIPDKGLVANEATYDYLISVPDLNRIVAELEGRIDDIPSDAVVSNTELAYAEGTGSAVTNLARLTDDYPRTVTAVLASQPYQRRVAMIASRVFEEMQGFKGQTAADLSRVLREGLENGQNPKVVARTIRERFGVSKSRAERIARTEITGALRRGHWDENEDARQNLGINTALMWFSALSSTTRRTHASKHGKVLTPSDVKSFYSRDGNAINCYLPGTRVRGRFVAGSKAHYTGDIIHIMTAGGRNLSVTPNHPVMTDGGLVAAAELHVGQNLLANKIEVEDFAGISDLNCELADALIEDVFSSLSNFGHAHTARVGAVDFHGDGRFINKYVDIVDADRVLTFGCNAEIGKALDDLKLISSNPIPSGSGPLGSCLNSVLLSASGFLGRLSHCLPVFRRVLSVPRKLGLAHPPVAEPLALKPSVQGYATNSCIIADGQHGFAGFMSGVKGGDIKGPESCHVSGKPSCFDAKTGGDGLDAFPVPVSLDSIVDIRVTQYSGHVYDLQEVSGLMVANGVISSNCKCSQQSVLVDDSGAVVSKGLEKRLKEQRKDFEPGEGLDDR